jgi:hypothetical protein
MSIWNLKLKERRVVLKIKKIIRRNFPNIEILDQKETRHLIFYPDLNCSREQWDQISEGTEIMLTLRERVVGSIILPAKPRFRKTKVIIPQAPYYRWTCLICNKTGIISYEDWEEPLRIGEHIIKAHRKASKKCDSESLQIIDHNGQDKSKEFMQIIGLKARETGK